MIQPIKSQPQVVVVEDQSLIAFTLAQVLYLSGFAVKIFGSAADLLAALPIPSPQCLVLATEMPGMSGFELFERLAALDSCVPAIFVASQNTPKERAQIHKIGGFGLIARPIDDEVFVTYVREAVNCQSQRALGFWPPGLMAFPNFAA